MALAIALSRLIEVEVRPQALTVGAQPVASASPDPGPQPQAQSPQPQTPVAPQPEAKAPGRSPAGRTYTVRPGDTLGAISKKAYGTTRHWKAILQANRDVIPSEAKMRAGAVLRLPNIPR